MKEGIMYNITEEGETMTREQQGEVVSIIHGKGGWLEDVSGFGGSTKVIRGCDAIYTSEIKRILSLGADIFYNEGEMKITNWTPDPPPMPEVLEEIKFRSFKDGEYNLVLRAVADENTCMKHDHVELWCKGNKLGYMHISKEHIHWWGEGDNRNSSGTMRIAPRDC